MNLEITVMDLDPILAAQNQRGVSVELPLEAKWYETAGGKTGQGQIVLCDPDGYLLRFCQLVD